MKLTDLFKQEFKISETKMTQIFESLASRYHKGEDPWGLDLDKTRKYLEVLYPVYKHYFQVRCFGLEHIENDTQYIFVSNHTGQIAFDGMLISMATVLELEKPRIVRGMIERWMAGLPFISNIAANAGSILGDRKNCLYLLDKEESILVFPEGVKGISKSTPQFYQMANFTNGFFRMALQKKVKVLPVAVVGAEEAYPWVHHSKKLAKSLGLPALPITPTFPLFGPLGFMPLPSPIDIHFGKAYELPEGVEHNAPDEDLNLHVLNIKNQIKEMLIHGLKERRPFMEKFGFEDKREL
jgi:1-acyl-sn-glycerol-3-phosphate acyltransferase